MVAKLKRIQDGSATEHTAQNIKRFTSALGLGVALSKAERAIRGDEAEVRERQVIRISGKEFAWVQPRCVCNHGYNEHDPRHPDRKLFPCRSEGCKCQKFEELIADEFDPKKEERRGIPDDLVVAVD